MNKTDRIEGRMLSAVLIMFLAELMFLPYAVHPAYAGSSESPDHVLSYTGSRLSWDSSTHVNQATGAAELSFFDSVYQNAVSDNGERLVAPGTRGSNTVRLKNETGHAISYIAVMYLIKGEAALPVEPDLADSDSFADTEDYSLPGGIMREQVVRAVTGTVKAGQLQDFYITWLWEYYESDGRDIADTALGNKAARFEPDDVTAGLYIVVEENQTDHNGPGEPDGPDGNYIHPEIPRTGDDGWLTHYLILMTVSGSLVFLVLLKQRGLKQ